MARLDFHLGAQVYCKDRACGKLLKVVANPGTMQITDLIVQTGLFLKTNRVVPVSVVEKAAGRGVRLALMCEGLDRLSKYYKDKHLVPLSNWMADEQYGQGLMWRAGRFCRVPPVSVGPMSRLRVHRGIPAGQIVVDRRTAVRILERTIGKVDHILVDRTSLKITHLIMNPGVFSRSHVIPISMIKVMDEEGIHVQATKKDLEGLFVFAHRDDAEILADVGDRLATLFPKMMAVTLGVDKGVVQMIGVVHDEVVRHQVEEVVRSVDGVIAVENLLYADTSIVLRVKSALANDPRTKPVVDRGQIRVLSDWGTVTLEGRVDDSEIRTAAKQMASRQPGVFSVIDLLETEGDVGSRVSGRRNDKGKVTR
jgi:osmotically-inducible protein OsmY